MAKGQQRLSKGFYQYSQADNFVAVKNYIFIYEDGKKNLLLRFVNDLGFEVDSMEYTVVQFDVDGNILDNTKVKHKAMKFLPGQMFATDTPIAVDGRCCDFKVVFSCVRSGDFAYTVREGKVIADYVWPQLPLLPKNKRGIKEAKSFSVKRKRCPRLTLVTVVSPLVALALTLAFILMYMTFDYSKDYKESKQKNSNTAQVTYVIDGDAEA